MHPEHAFCHCHIKWYCISTLFFFLGVGVGRRGGGGIILYTYLFCWRKQQIMLYTSLVRNLIKSVLLVFSSSSRCGHAATCKLHLSKLHQAQWFQNQNWTEITNGHSIRWLWFIHKCLLSVRIYYIIIIINWVCRLLLSEEFLVTIKSTFGHFCFVLFFK